MQCPKKGLHLFCVTPGLTNCHLGMHAKSLDSDDDKLVGVDHDLFFGRLNSRHLPLTYDFWPPTNPPQPKTQSQKS